METRDPPRFGELVRRHRTAAVLSQEELAERAGLSVRAISDLERGVHRAPRLETVRMLADALALSGAGRAELLAAARPHIVAPVHRERAQTHPLDQLPIPPTRLIGRETEVAVIARLLAQDDVRLVTITGPGGVGKTRLALQAAAELLGTFPDGVWFVDLSVLDDPSLVPSVIAGVLGVRVAHRLAAMLAGKQLLLLLDNFERVVDAASVVADLLARAPGLKVLTTSRTPLHAYGEREFPLLPFPMPDLGRLPSVEVLSQYEAVRLFIERAQAVKPNFALTNANAPAVAELCSRLEGLPLAIELAAAYVKVLPPQALLKRLEQRLPLLTGGPRTLPARQRTMRDAIAWSHDLLPPDEQTLFRRLAAFPGGCTIEAAEAVASADGTQGVFAGLAALVDKSLLRQDEGADGEPRFRMLETVREFGLEQLEASGEADETRRRQAAWCLELAEEARPERVGGSMTPRWMTRLDDEWLNLRAGATWLLEGGEAASVLRLLADTEDFWSIRLPDRAGLRLWLTAALTAAPAAPAADRAVALHLLAAVANTAGDYEEALAHAQHALLAANESGDPAVLGLIQYDVGASWEHCGDVGRAVAAYADAVTLLRAAGNEYWAAWALADHADKLVWLGDLDTAIPMLDEALTLHRAHGFKLGIAMASGQRGHAALAQRDLVRAAGLFAESVAVAREVDFVRTLLGAVAGLAGVALALGDAERAARLFGATDAARAHAGIGRVDHHLHSDRLSQATRAALGTNRFEQAWSAGGGLSLEEAAAEALAMAEKVAAQADG